MFSQTPQLMFNNVPRRLSMNILTILQLRGIKSNYVYTSGEIQINFGNFTIEFQIIDNDFQIQENGLLGAKFLKEFDVLRF